MLYFSPERNPTDVYAETWLIPQKIYSRDPDDSSFPCQLALFSFLSLSGSPVAATSCSAVVPEENVSRTLFGWSSVTSNNVNVPLPLSFTAPQTSTLSLLYAKLSNLMMLQDEKEKEREEEKEKEKNRTNLNLRMWNYRAPEVKMWH